MGFSLIPERPGLRAHPAEWAGAETTGSLSCRGSLHLIGPSCPLHLGSPCWYQVLLWLSHGQEASWMSTPVLILRQQDLSHCLPLCSSSLS